VGGEGRDRKQCLKYLPLFRARPEFRSHWVLFVRFESLHPPPPTKPTTVMMTQKKLGPYLDEVTSLLKEVPEKWTTPDHEEFEKRFLTEFDGSDSETKERMQDLRGYSVVTLLENRLIRGTTDWSKQSDDDLLHRFFIDALDRHKTHVHGIFTNIYAKKVDPKQQVCDMRLIMTFLRLFRGLYMSERAFIDKVWAIPRDREAFNSIAPGKGSPVLLNPTAPIQQWSTGPYNARLSKTAVLRLTANVLLISAWAGHWTVKNGMFADQLLDHVKEHVLLIEDNKLHHRAKELVKQNSVRMVNPFGFE